MKTTVLILLLAVSVSLAAEPETKFLLPGEPVIVADFDDGKNPGKPNWQLRKSTWVVKDGILEGRNAGGNGPFIRLHSKEKGGVLPEDYIMTFSFKIGENPNEKKSNKHHETYSSGHRFSLGHYAAKFQWRPDSGMNINIGHGDALVDSTFHIERHKWYHVTIEVRADEILTWFKDGPAYFMQHDHFRSKPSGWEFFTHVSEIGYLDNLKVWSLAEGEQEGWQTLKPEIANAKRIFLSSENPDFAITKAKKESSKKGTE